MTDKTDAPAHEPTGETPMQRALRLKKAAQGKHGEGKRAAGVVQVAQASNAYGKYFSHSGWKAIPLAH